MLALLSKKDLEEFSIDSDISDVADGLATFVGSMIDKGFVTASTKRIGGDLVLEFNLNRNAILNAPSATGTEVFPIDSIIHDTESQDVKVASVTLQPHHRRQLRDVMEMMDKESAEWVLRNLIENAHLIYNT